MKTNVASEQTIIYEVDGENKFIDQLNNLSTASKLYVKDDGNLAEAGLLRSLWKVLKDF